MLHLSPAGRCRVGSVEPRHSLAFKRSVAAGVNRSLVPRFHRADSDRTEAPRGRWVFDSSRVQLPAHGASAAQRATQEYSAAFSEDAVVVEAREIAQNRFPHQSMGARQARLVPAHACMLRPMASQLRRQEVYAWRDSWPTILITLIAARGRIRPRLSCGRCLQQFSVVSRQFSVQEEEKVT